MELVYCEHCKRFFYPASMVKVANTGETICLSCVRYYDEYTRCEECGEVFDSNKEMMTWIGSGGYVCESCFKNYNYVACYDCGDCYREQDMQYDRFIEDYLCPDCRHIPSSYDELIFTGAAECG